MISAAFFLLASLAGGQSSMAQDSSSECNRMMSEVSKGSSRHVLAGLTNQKEMMLNVVSALENSEELMKDAVKRQASFADFKKEARTKGLKIHDEYHERLYTKLYVARNCSDSATEASAGPNNLSAFNTPADANLLRQIDDVTRELGPPPGSMAPAESGR